MYNLGVSFVFIINFKVKQKNIIIGSATGYNADL
ncbi:hypothetical protein ACIKQ1_09505, partial [Acinetobacter baumannii]